MTNISGVTIYQSKSGKWIVQIDSTVVYTTNSQDDAARYAAMLVTQHNK